MAVLSRDVNCSALGLGIKAPFSANGADTFYRGALVYIDTGGGVQSVPAAGDKCIGVSPFKQVTTAAGQIVQVIIQGVIWLPVGTNVAAADEGDVLVEDISASQTDNPADKVAAGDITTAANDIVIGQILRVTSTQMLIAIIPGVTGRIYAATATNAWT